MKNVISFLIVMIFTTSAWTKASAPKGVLPELQLNKKTEAENLKTAAEAETLISKSEEKAIKQLEALLKKYRGTSQEPDLQFRLAELYARRAKTGRFVDLYRGEKTLAEILTPKLTEKGAKNYLGQAISIYQNIHQKFPRYAAMDEVLFNMAFAHEQRGEPDLALKTFTIILERHPDSTLLPETHMALGELYFQKQNYHESQKNFDKIQEWPTAPIAPIALYKSAWCSYNLKNTPEAIKKIELILKQSKDQPQLSHVRTEAKRDLALFYSESGEVELAIPYFHKHLLEAEIGPTVLELSAVYERHGKNKEMDLVLEQFLKAYPRDISAGTIFLKRIQRPNEEHQTKLVINLLKEASKLCQNNQWKNKSKETGIFCQTTYPEQLRDLVAEWWENWNKLRRSPDMIPELSFIFKEYLSFEPEQAWNIGIHMSYADFLFSQKDFKQAYDHYAGVSRIEPLDPKVLHDSLYGQIVCLDRQLQNTPKEIALRRQLSTALNEYIDHCPKGDYVDEAAFKKAFLFFEDKDYIQSLDWIKKVNPKTTLLKEKKEDLLLEIHRSKKDYQAIVDSSLLILKSSTGERAKKMKSVYQAAQQAIIQELIEKNQLELAAGKAKSFYDEHKPESKALEALHLSIELWEKQKKYRNAAELSELLAQEMKSAKKLEDAEKVSQHAVQLFLQLGDLNRAQTSIQKAIDLAQQESKKKESLELLAEISSWYGNVEQTEKAWQSLESYLSPSEKQNLLNKRIKFLESQAPEKATQLKQVMIQKGIEPFYSEAQLTQTNQLCQQQKWQQCYQMSLKLNRDATPSKIRAQARYLQGQVLVNEYKQQSLNARADRLGMVMAYKAEKFDKAVQVLNTVSQKSEILALRKKAIQDLISMYKDYVTQLEKSMEGLDPSHPDSAPLKQEIAQILPILSSRPKDLEKVAAELETFKETSEESESVAKLTESPFPELLGSELRVYVPTWEETSALRPLADIPIGNQSCSQVNIRKISSLSSLGKEANFCLAKKNYKELEFVALKLSDLFPESVWGPYYLSLSASQQRSRDRALFYLQLAQKRGTDPFLTYEDIRQKFMQKPNSNYLSDLKKLDGQWKSIEEVTFLGVLDQLQKPHCAEATSLKLNLHAGHWKNTALEKISLLRCPAKTERVVSSTDNEL